MHRANTKKQNIKEQYQCFSIMADGMWTPERAHKRCCRPSPLCNFCRQAKGTIDHMWWDCPVLRWRYSGDFQALQRRRQSPAEPPCLWLLGLVPKGYIPRATSPYCLQAERVQELVVGQVHAAFTDGSAVRTPCGWRADWGVYLTPNNVGRTRALRGACQTSQRAEA